MTSTKKESSFAFPVTTLSCTPTILIAYATLHSSLPQYHCTRHNEPFSVSIPLPQVHSTVTQTLTLSGGNSSFTIKPPIPIPSSNPLLTSLSSHSSSITSACYYSIINNPIK